VIDVINVSAFLIFTVALLLGAGATLARVVRYSVQGWHRPRLLTRDLFVIGGLALTVGTILAVRVARALGADVTGLATSIPWILFTTIPVVVAVVVYAWFELFVIERGLSDQPYAEREHNGSSEDHIG
jgi:hypothetical protein